MKALPLLVKVANPLHFTCLMCFAFRFLLHPLNITQRWIVCCQPSRSILRERAADAFLIVLTYCLESFTQSLLMIFGLVTRCLLLILDLSIFILHILYLFT